MSADRLAFERIAVRRAPGFEDRGFELTDLSPGVNLVHGPQAVGKSTTGRAIAWLLWPAERAWRGQSMAARLRIGDEQWLADADHGPPRLEREGHEASRLPTPGRELADRYSLALHDLLRAETDDAGIAGLINQELAGGFDLDAALEEVGALARPRSPRKLEERFKEAMGLVRSAEEEQAALADDELSLDRLRRDEGEARRAGRQRAEVEVVLEWRRRRDAVAREERVLAEGFPEAMERLTGDEADRLAELDAGIEEAQGRLEDLRRRIERAQRQLEESDLPEGGVPEATLVTLDQERRRAELLESAIAERRSTLEGARRSRDDARGRLGAAAQEEALRNLGPDDWRPLLELARRGERLRGRRAQAEDVEDWIGRVAAPEGVEELRAGAGRLRRWLASPAGLWRVATPGLAGALLFTAGVLALAVSPDGRSAFGLPEPLVWGGVALGAILTGWLAIGLLRGISERRAAEREYQGLALDPPKGWSTEAVEERLRALERRLVEAAVEQEKAQRWADLASRRERLEREETALEAEREEVLERLGVAPDLTTALDDAPLAALVRDLCAFRAADEAVREQDSVLAARVRERDEVLAAAGERLAAFGYPMLESGPGAVETLAGRIDELGRREEARSGAREVLDEAAGPDGTLAREEASVRRLESEREELFERLALEPGDRGALARLLELLPDYREQVELVREARYGLERARAELPEEGDDGPALLELPEEELEARRDELERRAARLEELVRRIGVIEDRVARAKKSHNLEDALAARDDALAALGEERERDADALVAHELGAWLREQMRGRRRPSVMKRAAALFARITAGRFELLDPAGDPPALRARETASGRGRSLDELSGGIRLQLLLAVRMAFIEDREGSVRLPLVMDETLANSDDHTARAIIDAVLELARDGRQVFYLTAQVDEVAKWRAALDEAEDGPGWKEIDLAAVRRLREAEERPRSTWRPRAEPVPAPEGRGRDEYAEILDVPGLDPRRDVGAVHLWHLVEEPEVLHALMGERLEQWGQVETLGEAAVSYLGGGAEGERRHRRMSARARCLETLFEAWRQGRGRPVDRGVLLESGAVSDTFIDRVSDLAEELDGDPARLVEALRGGEVKGFRSAKMDELEQYLGDEGHLDERPTLTVEEIRTRTLTAVEADVEAGNLTVQEIEGFLARILGRERAGAPGPRS